MSLIVENGTGISTANAYASVAYVLAYLTNRNRQDENGWADLDLNVREANIIAATDYIENRYRRCFKGNKEFTSVKAANGTLTFVSNPLNTTTVILGSVTYTFVNVLAVANDVLIGANTSATIDNLVNAIQATAASEGVTHGTGTVLNPDAKAETFENDTMVATATTEGTPGNLVVSTTTVAGANWTSTTLIGGNDIGAPQPLSFPRVNLYDRDGILVQGIPDRLKQAMSEYAVRSAAATLQPDPDVTTGLQLIETDEKVDVLQEKKKYAEGGRVQISIPYPAADSLLNDYLNVAGLVLRA